MTSFLSIDDLILSSTVQSLSTKSQVVIAVALDDQATEDTSIVLIEKLFRDLSISDDETGPPIHPNDLGSALATNEKPERRGTKRGRNRCEKVNRRFRSLLIMIHEGADSCSSLRHSLISHWCERRGNRNVVGCRLVDCQCDC